jgi:signal transduction histidine kinase
VKGLSGLLTGILDIFKLDAGIVTPLVASVDLGGLVEKLVHEHQARAAAVGLLVNVLGGQRKSSSTT